METDTFNMLADCRQGMDERLEEFLANCGNWEERLEQEIRGNGCGKKHNELMRTISRHLIENQEGLGRGQDSIECIVAEKDAAGILGIEMPDLVVKWGNGDYECIEAQNGHGYSGLLRKGIRYGPVVDRFSIGINSSGMSYILKKWSDSRRFKVGMDRERMLYKEHLELLGMREVGADTENRVTVRRGQYFLEKNNGRRSKKSVKVDANLSAKLLDEVEGFNIGFYIVSEDCVSQADILLRPEQPQGP